MAFVTGHLGAHALLTLSLDVSSQGLRAVMSVWQAPLMLALLGVSAVIHASLSIATLLRRRDLHLPSWHMLQTILGLTIPLLLAGHVVMNRVMYEIAGTGTNYSVILLSHFVERPFTAVVQAALVIVVWAHGMIGLWHWLKQTRAFEATKHIVLTIGIGLPALVLAGFIGRGLDIRAQALADPDFAATVLMRAKWTPDATALFSQLAANTTFGILAAYLVLAAVPVTRSWVMRRASPGAIALPDRGPVPLIAGATLLESLRAARVPHTSICGGRARCTTCRVLVAHGGDDLAMPNTLEQAALDRINAPAGVRLACQIRPRMSLAATPLVPAKSVLGKSDRPALAGQETDLTVMFIDLRGSTRLAEKRLPYDVLFLLNRFFAEMVAALNGQRGHYANFTGDGLMALFGLSGNRERGARDALHAAIDMLDRVDALNRDMTQTLDEPLTIGIGIHSGLVIVGEMGPPEARLVSAIGDTVNTTARLESLSKDLGQAIIVSTETLEAANLPVGGASRHLVDVRGRTEPLAVHALGHAELAAVLRTSRK
ncbi:MAG: adenylate/guanylate cyclase domain-containing protein [Pseudomonadota bacterium]